MADTPLVPSKDALIHAGIAFLLSALLVLVAGPALAFAVPFSFFYGREMRDAERKDPTLMAFTWRRFWPGAWAVGNQRELLHPIIAAAIPALIGWLLP